MKTILSIPLFTVGCMLARDAVPTPETSTETDSASEMIDVVNGIQIDNAWIRVHIRCPIEAQADCEMAANAAIAEVERLENISSIWSTEGDVARINSAAGGDPVEISEDVHRMLTSAQIVSAASAGAFDVTIGAISGLWGIDNADLPDAVVLADRLQLVDWSQLHLEPGTAQLGTAGMSIVLDGLVKGDAADAALTSIPEEWDAMVDVSGDLAVRGEWQVDIAVEDSNSNEQVTLWVQDTVLVSSGVGGHGDLGGAIDPRTGSPSPGGSWAVASHPQGAIADALATTVLVTGPASPVVDQLGAWALIMTEDGWVEAGGRSAHVSTWSVQSIQ